MNNNLANGFLLTLGAFMLAACTATHAPYPADFQTKQMVAKINTDTDPRFVYDYEKTKFVPPEGKTLLIMGQSKEAIDEYIDNFADQPTPSGWSAYWGIPEFVGVTEAHTNETGSTMDHQMLVDRFPNTVVQSAMWMVGTWGVAKDTADGKYDNVVRQYSAWAKSVERPIYLRIGYEFDGPHNALEPEVYVKAYRRVVDIIRAEGISNIAFVWHSYAAPRFNDYPLADWYPGDDYVDWVGISVFGQAYASSGIGADGDEVLEFARSHKKPVMIAESNPVYGIDKVGVEAWDQWFVNYFSLIYNKNIKAISFINQDWSQVSIAGIEEWGDARLYNNPQISRAWFEETRKDRYLKQSPELFQQLGYSR